MFVNSLQLFIISLHQGNNHPILLFLYLYSSLQWYISNAWILTLHSPLLIHHSISSWIIILRIELPSYSSGSAHITYPRHRVLITSWMMTKQVLEKLHPSIIFLRELLIPTITGWFFREADEVRSTEKFEVEAVTERVGSRIEQGELFDHATCLSDLRQSNGRLQSKHFPLEMPCLSWKWLAPCTYHHHSFHCFWLPKSLDILNSASNWFCGRDRNKNKLFCIIKLENFLISFLMNSKWGERKRKEKR